MSDEKPRETVVLEERPPIFGALRAILRIRLIAGLLTVIPIWVTYVVVKFIFDAMRAWTEPLAWKVAKLLQKSPDPLLAKTVETYVNWIVPVLAVLLTLFLLYSLGLLTANVFGRRLIRGFERMFERVPLVKTIYKSTKTIVMTFGGGGHQAGFHRVVLIDFPHAGMKRIAFLTSVMTDKDTGRKLANIFIPYTPYLTTGYMQIVPLEDVSETDWTVEEAVKMVMSGGILSPAAIGFDRKRPVQWSKELETPPTEPAMEKRKPVTAPK